MSNRLLSNRYFNKLQVNRLQANAIRSNTILSNNSQPKQISYLYSILSNNSIININNQFNYLTITIKRDHTNIIQFSENMNINFVSIFVGKEIIMMYYIILGIHLQLRIKRK